MKFATYVKGIGWVGVSKIIVAQCSLKMYVSPRIQRSLLPPANEVWGKVIFSVACVRNSVHRVGVCLHAGIPPPRSRHTHSPRPGTPRAGPPGPGTPLPPQTRHPPRVDTPLRSACWEIRSTSGRYASYYWNEILLKSLTSKNSCQKIKPAATF